MNFIKDITPKGWITIAVVVILLIIIIMYFKNKNTATTTVTTTAPANPVTNTVVSATAPSTGDSFPLHYGSRGPNVSKWQTYLNSKGSTLKVDGIWGPLTEAASIKQTTFNNITEAYFNAVVK